MSHGRGHKILPRMTNAKLQTVVARFICMKSNVTRVSATGKRDKTR